jgi:DNA-binding MarR family transcriptional regulator
MPGIVQEEGSLEPEEMQDQMPRKLRSKAIPAPQYAARNAAAPGRKKSKSATSGICTHEIVDPGSPGFLISATARILGRSLAMALREHGVAPGQWSVLRHLWVEEGLSQRELSTLVSIEEATLTRTIDRLVRDKLAVRRRSATNRRQHAIFLSERGRQLRDVLIPLVGDLNRQATRRLSPKALQALIDNLSLIRSTVAEDLKFQDARPSTKRQKRTRS